MRQHKCFKYLNTLRNSLYLLHRKCPATHQLQKVVFAINKLSKWIYYVILPLLAGGLIYILFKYPVPFFTKITGIDHALVNIPQGIISDFIRFHLADMLWTFALAATLYLITDNQILSFILAFLCVISVELFQLLNLFNGTCDILDILFSLCSLIIFIYIGRNKDEKGT